LLVEFDFEFIDDGLLVWIVHYFLFDDLNGLWVEIEFGDVFAEGACGGFLVGDLEEMEVVSDVLLNGFILFVVLLKLHDGLFMHFNFMFKFGLLF
jgi:hypothetical protein